MRALRREHVGFRRGHDWVTEVWKSKEHHTASLELPEVKEAIGKAMPLLTGEFTGQ
ncbi:hypothetical protein GCM10009533_30080 [Saccharopolyspora spinosporotrichia]|uniref:Uncharacterized protein n=1 Tax=Saccharopolyspora erythraea TaxID=1836 RepID=A0ABP3MZ24_SACER